METVYETTFGFHAQMICDLLIAAGVPARVDGSYLQGISGEIPVGNAVRVRVEPARAAEARAIIAEWESAEVPSDEEAAAEAEAAGLGAEKRATPESGPEFHNARKKR
jgi:hypothetical protein